MQQTEKKSAQTAATVLDTNMSSQTQTNYTLNQFVRQVGEKNDILERILSVDLDRIDLVLANTIADMEKESSINLLKYPQQAQFVYDRMPYYCAVLDLALETFRSAFDDLSCVFERLRDCTSTMKGGAAK